MLGLKLNHVSKRGPCSNGIRRIDLLVFIQVTFTDTVPTFSLLQFQWHRNGNVIILMKFSSLAAPKVVKMTTFSAASDENFVKMTTFPFRCEVILVGLETSTSNKSQQNNKAQTMGIIPVRYCTLKTPGRQISGDLLRKQYNPGFHTSWT